MPGCTQSKFNIALALLTASSLLISITGCDTESPLPQFSKFIPGSATRVTYLLDKGREDAPNVRVEESDGDFRSAWVIALSQDFAADFKLAARDCELILGVRANGIGDNPAGRVVARILQATKNGGESVIFEKELSVARQGKGPWLDDTAILPTRTIDLPADTTLRFNSEVIDSENIVNGTISWSNPHVVCPSLAVARRAPPPAPHVVLISIDTLRADHLSLYGYRRRTSPFLDEFAQEAVVFSQAFSTAPWTAPAHASMFTGLYPERHLAGHADPFAPLPDDIDTMATILRRNGYRTIGFAAGGVMSPKSGLAQGFDRYDSYARTRLRSFFPAILEEVEKFSEQPIFLFIHTYDVHGPYIQPIGQRAFDADDNDRRIKKAEWERLRQPGLHDYQRLERFDGLHDVIAAYDSGIHYVDSELRVLFGKLDATGFLENALIIITSDHGEVLYDRDLYIGHTYTLHDEVLHVPLIVRRVGQRRGERTAVLVDSTDLLPLVLDGIGIERPSGLDGRNPMRQEEGERPFVRGEAAHTGATFIRTTNKKVITPLRPFSHPQSQVPGGLRDRIQRGEQWYDLASDTGERINRYLKDARSVNTSLSRSFDDLKQRLVKEAKNDLVTDTPATRDLSEVEKQELRSLGYAE